MFRGNVFDEHSSRINGFCDNELKFSSSQNQGHLWVSLEPYGGHDSFVGIATRFELEGSGSESRLVQESPSSPYPSIPTLGTIESPVQ